MDPQEYKIYQTAKAQGKDDAFIKGAIQAYRATKPAPVNHLDGFSIIGQTPPKTTGSAGQTVLPGSTLKSNLKALPGALLDAGKALFKTVTGSEQAVGSELASGLPARVTGEADLNKANQGNAASDVAFVKAINAKKAAGQKLTTAQQQMYDHILETHSSVGTQTDLLPHAADTNAEALTNVGGVALDALAPGGASKGAKIAKTALTSTAEEIAVKDAAKVAEVVAPKLSAKEAADALATRGGTKTGLLRTIEANVDPAVQRVADTVAKYVPDFSPKKSLVENINVTKKAVSNLAEDLKAKVVASGQDRIYSFKELSSTLNKLEKPTLLTGDLEKAYGRVVNKAMEIARSNGGKVSDLFQARKEFDDFVRQSIPNLYSSDTLTPMRSAIKNVRNAITDFTAEHLPEDVGLRDSLTNQSRLLEAIENMSAKAASGVQKEVGTNIIERATNALKKHPVLGGFGGAAAYETAKKTPVIGGLLP